ncbi:nucleoside hydrolase, partial [Acidisphaera rubrifaciens]|uniref:nucleoside hydrolase n=1 Tax=Acidisphaera rubrifaciens TaxID=50715 RepID=UPI00066255BC
AAGGGTCLRAACDILDGLPRGRPEGEPLHDPCAVAWLIAPHLFTARTRPVTVVLEAGPARGRTVFGPPEAPGGGGRVRVLETADADGVFALLATHLARLP